ncbi:MAG: acetyltransferase [Candidatus Omnitrophica bacterium]|nr:acetyltransferase [Candidatus Omnitrophota bacterium]
MAKKIKEDIVLIGGGGHAKVVIDAVRKVKKIRIYGIVDSKLRKGDSFLGVPILGDDSVLPELFKKGIKKAFIAVGSIGGCSIRKKLYANLKNIGFELPAIKHQGAVIAGDVKIGEGSFVAAGAVINPGVKIGKNVIINTRASIDHDCEIGDFVHIAPGVTLSGGVKIDKETHVGTGANIIQYVKIGKGCLISAGSTIIRNVADKENNCEFKK